MINLKKKWQTLKSKKNLLNKGMAASLGSVSLSKRSVQNSMNAAMAASLQSFNLSRNTRRKPTVVVDLCKGMTIQEIRQFLLSMGVGEDAIPPRMLKKDLCALYKSLTE